MTKIDDGGPAFPVTVTVTQGNFDPFQKVKVEAGKEHEHVFVGMSLRQHYAGLAMQGLCMRCGYDDVHHAARVSIALADALIAALKEGDE